MGTADTLPSIVYKTRGISDGSTDSDDGLIGYDEPPFTDERIALAETRIELRNELRTEAQAMIADGMAEIRERVAKIEGQLSRCLQ
jgi:hypothetical protein